MARKKKFWNKLKSADKPHVFRFLRFLFKMNVAPQDCNQLFRDTK